MQNNLFSSLDQELRIVSLGRQDVATLSDDWLSLRSLVLECESQYPGIDDWIDRTVRKSMQANSRRVYVAYYRDKPVVSAVLKLGVHTKFCHLRISSSLEDSNLGEIFFALMTLEARSRARTIHFTLPESLWERKRHFFGSFAFDRAKASHRQYRLFEDELRCSASFADVWTTVLCKLPKLRSVFKVGGGSVGNNLLMSVKPRFADAIIAGTKRVEIRKHFAKEWIGHTATIYATSPEKKIVGEADVHDVISGDPKDIWDNYHTLIGCRKEDYDLYVNGASSVKAVVIGDVRPFARAISLDTVSSIVNERLRPPQTHIRVNEESSWGRAISVSALLQSPAFQNINV